MDTAILRRILLGELESYTGTGLNDSGYLTANEAEHVYAVIDIAMLRHRRLVTVVLVARLANEPVVIELHQHDRLLAAALKSRSVPGRQMVLAYRGDVIPNLVFRGGFAGSRSQPPLFNSVAYQRDAHNCACV